MRLSDYVQELPVASRREFRQRLADAHGCSVSLVRKWENHPPPESWDQQKIASMSRKHPADMAAMKITEDQTGGKVTRFDLRPEIWGSQ